MNAIVLVVIIFFMHKAPISASIIEPDIASCQQVGQQFKQDQLQKSEVRGAEWLCFSVKGSEKT